MLICNLDDFDSSMLPKLGPVHPEVTFLSAEERSGPNFT